MTAVTIYSRPGCHLCDEMKALVDRIARTVPLTIAVVDISADAELEARYGVEVPVLVIDGVKAAKYRIEERELRKVLLARSAPDPSSGSGKSG